MQRRSCTVQLLCLLVLFSVTRVAAQPLCAGDLDGDGQVIVSELVQAVNNAVSGCAQIPITLRFRAMVGDQPFACGQSYADIGTGQTDIIPADFRLFVYDIRLITTQGREVPLSLVQDGMWQQGDLALLDFEDRTRPCNEGTPQMNSEIRGLAPAAAYSGVRFSLGVPFDLNHENAALARSPLNITAMFWSWNAGYKFIRVDEAQDIVRVHIGSTGCVNGSNGKVESCSRPNRPEVILRDFDPSTNIIVADLAALLADSDLEQNDPETSPGCSAEPDDSDCEAIFRNIGLNFSNGMPDPSRQTFFHVE